MASMSELEAGEIDAGDIAPESPEFNEGYAVEGDDYLYAEEDDEMTYDVVCEEPEEFDPDVEYDAFNEESRTVEW